MMRAIELYRSRFRPLEFLAHPRMMLAVNVVGAGKVSCEEFIVRTHADELIIVAQIFDHAARLRSYELTAAVGRSIAACAE